MPSTSWQWDPDTKQATCCYCGFTTEFAGDVPGEIDHECNPAKHPPLITRQGHPIGRSPRPEAASRLRQFLSCAHRGLELRQELCPTCSGNVRIKIFACALHRECQMDDKIAGPKCCAACEDRRPAELV